MTAVAYAEVLGNPYSAYVAPVGTVFPALDAAPAAGWVLLGTNGINNLGSQGVTIGFSETIAEFTPAGLTLPVKAWRTDEKATVSLSLADLTVEMFAKIVDDATVTTVAPGVSIAGEKNFKMLRGVSLKYFALLVRGLSPYDDGTGVFNAQYQFSRVYQSGSQQIQYQKGQPAELAVEFTICGDLSGNDPMVYRAQNALHA